MVFVALGDWGADPGGRVDPEDPTQYGYNDQIEVGQAMGEWCAEYDCDFIVTTGDNFYPDGVTGVDDPRWYTNWYDVYDQHESLQNLDWYVSVGNHDHYLIENPNRVWYQVEFSDLEPRWILKELYYDTVIEKDDIRLFMNVIDSEALIFRFYNYTMQYEFFNASLERSHEMDPLPDWRFVVAHHPIRSCGRYAPGSPRLRQETEPTMDYYDVDVYLTGHDHNLQHITRQDGSGMDYVISGGGGRGRYDLTEVRCQAMIDDGYNLNAFHSEYGFVGFVMEKNQFTAHYIGKEGVEYYNFTRIKA